MIKLAKQFVCLYEHKSLDTLYWIEASHDQSILIKIYLNIILYLNFEIIIIFYKILLLLLLLLLLGSCEA